MACACCCKINLHRGGATKANVKSGGYLQVTLEEAEYQRRAAELALRLVAPHVKPVSRRSSGMGAHCVHMHCVGKCMLSCAALHKINPLLPGRSLS